jgi:hypothetical protein
VSRRRKGRAPQRTAARIIEDDHNLRARTTELNAAAFAFARARGIFWTRIFVGKGVTSVMRNTMRQIYRRTHQKVRRGGPRVHSFLPLFVSSVFSRMSTSASPSEPRNNDRGTVWKTLKTVAGVAWVLGKSKKSRGGAWSTYAIAACKLRARVRRTRAQRATYRWSPIC